MSKNLRTTEQRQQLRTTAELIKRYGVGLVLFRPPAMVDDGIGGLRRPTGEPDPIDEQVLYFGGKEGVNPEEETTNEGDMMVSTHVLVGMPSTVFGFQKANIREHDLFNYEDKLYEVIWVHHDKRYQIKAECVVVTGGS